MQWLAPMTAVYAASAAVPLLVLMYFLKLKRREHLVSSTLLWRRAVRDLQVNAPFQKLRRNLLLLLQLLALLAILAALGRPVLSLTAGPGRRYVILIDRSASMGATDVAPSRLAEAKRRAKMLADSLRGRTGFSLADRSDQALVIAFDQRAQVMCNFTSDKRQIKAAIAAVTQGDGSSALAEAITVAQAYAQSPGADANNRSAAQPAQLELFSDGRIGDVDELALGAAELNFHAIGSVGQNVAVVAMQARRSYENPEQADVFASLANYGDDAATVEVQLSVNGDIRAVREVRIGPARKADSGQLVRAGNVAVSFALRQPGAAVLELRQLRPDALAADDAAWAILQPPKSLAALLVTEGNPPLEMALAACPLAKLDVATPGEFDAMDHAAMTASRQYDLIVLDRHAPAGLPRGRYILFGRPPEDIGVQVGPQLADQFLIDWRARHSVLQFVDLSNLYAAKCWQMTLPRDAEVLAEFTDGPALALVRRGGREILLVGFDLLESNWPFEPGFVMFCYNAANFLGLEATMGQPNSLSVGEPIVVEGLAPGAAAELSGPGIAGLPLRADDGGRLRFPATDRAGLYNIMQQGRQMLPFAVNVLDAAESDIAPAGQIAFMGQQVQAQQGPPVPANVELWPLLTLLALVLVCLEWLVYNSKIRL